MGGYLTLEFSNASSADCRIYANEGVLQLLFFRREPCQTTYADRWKVPRPTSSCNLARFSNLDLEFTRLSSQDSRAAMPFATSEHRLKVLH